MEKIIEERQGKRRQALRIAYRFAKCVERRLGPVKVIIYGSYARGDFNVWSDIDVLVITREVLPENPVQRLDLIEECISEYPVVEPVIITVEELIRRKNNPIIREALERGVVVYDSLGGVKEHSC